MKGALRTQAVLKEKTGQKTVKYTFCLIPCICSDSRSCSHHCTLGQYKEGEPASEPAQGAGELTGPETTEDADEGVNFET